MSDAERRILEPQYGRLLDDFKVGEVYHHPWEVTLDEGMMALWAGSFLDANPLYSSRRFACELGFRDRVVPPLLLLNLALSASVHDVSEQAIAHLAYLNVRFPNAAYAGDTLSVRSEVLGGHASASKPDRGVVTVRTTGVNQQNVPVVTFERKALVPAGRLANRAHPDAAVRAPLAAIGEAVKTAANTAEKTAEVPAAQADVAVLKTSEAASKEGDGGRGDASQTATVVCESVADALRARLRQGANLPVWAGRPRGWFEDFTPGDIILHGNGRTIGESEHMQLTMLTRNSHPLHVDAVYAEERSFTGRRVVCGPLVFAWVASLASRDTTANALWEESYDLGSHAAPVHAGDTLFAASRVIEKRDAGDACGVVRFHLVGVKNKKPAAGERAGFDVFGGKVEERVFEIEREVLLPKLQAIEGGRENSDDGDSRASRSR